MFKVGIECLGAVVTRQSCNYSVPCRTYFDVRLGRNPKRHTPPIAALTVGISTVFPFMCSIYVHSTHKPALSSPPSCSVCYLICEPYISCLAKQCSSVLCLDPLTFTSNFSTFVLLQVGWFSNNILVGCHCWLLSLAPFLHMLLATVVQTV